MVLRYEAAMWSSDPTASCGLPGLREAYIIHARGDEAPDIRRVRKDMLFDTFDPKLGWIYKYIRYSE
jgi:hypothetical protein